MRIAIYGAASHRMEEKYILAVEELSRKLAQRGHTLIFGAGKTGLMGASARGFHEGGSTITGIVPKFFKAETIEPLCKDCDTMIYTENMSERKSVITSNADAFIAMPGGIGTCDEFFETVTLKQLNVINAPIVLFNLFGFYDKLYEFLQYSMGENVLRANTLTLFKMFDETQIDEMITYLETPEEDVDRIQNVYGDQNE